MQISAINIHQVTIPLRVQFSQANNTTNFSNSIILEIETSSGQLGYGESCPRSYVTGETILSVQKDIHRIIPILKSYQFDSLVDIQNFVVEKLPQEIGQAAICAVELALLDAWGKKHQYHLIDRMGNSNKQLQYTGIIPLQSMERLSLFLDRIKPFQFHQLKLKVDASLEMNLEKILLIQDVYPNATIRIDANCGWTLTQAKTQIPVYLERGIQVFEQLFQKDMLEESKTITKEFGKDISLMLDESFTSLEEAQFLIRHKIGNRFNFKLSKNGGIFNALKIYNLLIENGMTCQLGAHFGETSILTAAGLLFSSMTTDVTTHEGAFGEYLLEKDICTPSISFDKEGQIDLQAITVKGSGLGIDVSSELISRYSNKII